MPTIKELQEKRLSILDDAQKILDAVGDEGFKPEEEERFDKLHESADRVERTIERMQTHEETKARDAEVEERTPVGPAGGENRGEAQAAQEKNAEDFRNWLLTGETPEGRHLTSVVCERGLPPLDYRGSVVLPPEVRALTALKTTAPNLAAGGYTVGESFATTLEEAMKRFNGMRLAPVDIMRTPKGEKFNLPTANDTNNEGERVAESAAVTKQDTTFGNVIIDAYKYSSKEILVPIELIQDSLFDIESYIAKILGERIGRITGREFTVNDGDAGGPAAGPNGALNAAHDIAVSGTVADFSWETFVDIETALEASYVQGAMLMFNRQTLALIKKLKDSQNRPLWLPNTTVNGGNTVLGYSYVENDYMPNPTGTNRFIMFGQFNKFMIRDVMDVELHRLGELYIRNGQIGFLAFSRHDSELLDAGTHPLVKFGYTG